MFLFNPDPRSLAPVCFNPCFSGCTSSISTSSPYELVVLVSILVLVDVPLQLKVPPCKPDSPMLFQSLFQWMYLFNLRFLLTHQTSCRFQSLFQWMYLFNQGCSLCHNKIQQGFNPCFSGCTSSIPREAMFPTSKRSDLFQSLFQWMYLFNSDLLRPELREVCFNPCFSGCTSSIVTSTGAVVWGLVSILVLVDVPLQLDKPKKRSEDGYVSILVLVDVPLQSSSWMKSRTSRAEFQSLFQWMYLFNLAGIELTLNPLEFQSLFQWMYLFNQRQLTGRENLLEFQSLFQWMYLFNQKFRLSNRERHWCFNPCFSGCTSSIEGSGNHPSSTLSFNPCFSGCTSSIGIIEKVPWVSMVFQSLFQWMYLFNEYGYHIADPDKQFQSLFQWMYLFNLGIMR